MLNYHIAPSLQPRKELTIHSTSHKEDVSGSCTSLILSFSVYSATKAPAKSNKPGTTFAFAAAVNCTGAELLVLVATLPLTVAVN
jgi:hypothetical protein